MFHYVKSAVVFLGETMTNQFYLQQSFHKKICFRFLLWRLGGRFPPAMETVCWLRGNMEARGLSLPLQRKPMDTVRARHSSGFHKPGARNLECVGSYSQLVNRTIYNILVIGITGFTGTKLKMCFPACEDPICIQLTFN